jgi:hypothetical protein
MAGKDFGGIMKVSTSAGDTFSLRGKLKVLKAHAKNDAVTNQDGSVDRTMTPQAPSAELTFRDDDFDFDAMLSGNRVNITIIEQQTGKTHLFTNAFWTGSPASDRMNGEVDSMGIVCESYQQIG